MNGVKIIGIVLLLAGIAGLIMGGFSYTKESHDVKLGPVEMSVKEKDSVAIPTWTAIAAIVAGAALLIVGGCK